MSIWAPKTRPIKLRLRAGGEGGYRGWDGWMASSIKWTSTWTDSGRWWGTGRPGVLQSLGSQRVSMTERLNRNNKSWESLPFLRRNKTWYSLGLLILHLCVIETYDTTEKKKLKKTIRAHTLSGWLKNLSKCPVFIAGKRGAGEAAACCYFEELQASDQNSLWTFETPILIVSRRSEPIS